MNAAQCHYQVQAQYSLLTPPAYCPFTRPTRSMIFLLESFELGCVGVSGAPAPVPKYGNGCAVVGVAKCAVVGVALVTTEAEGGTSLVTMPEGGMRLSTS